MKMTHIYWKRFNRPFLAVASFVLGCFLTVSALVVDRVNARSPDDVPAAAPLELPDFSTSRIASFSQLGNHTSYRLIDRDHQSLTTDDLARQGFRIVPVSACLVRIKNGVTHAEIRC